MSCQVLSSLSSAAVAAVPSLPVPVGLGAREVLQEQSQALARAVVVLQRELAIRMAASEREGPSDVRGDAVAAGLGQAQASRLRLLGVFAAEHEELQQAWLSDQIGDDLVMAVRDGATKLATPALRERLVELVLPHLPGLDGKRARRLVAHVVDQLQPGDPDQDELSDHAARRLVWSRTPRGGMVFEGFLPPAEAEKLAAAVSALVEELRASGDGLSTAQRQADALIALLDRSALPKGGGLPPAMTLTVSVEEAARVALRDPKDFGQQYQLLPHGGSQVGQAPAGDAAVRFGVCCAAVTPVLHDGGEAPGGLLGRIAGTRVNPLAVGRSVRLATPAQRTALQRRDDGCVIPGCAVAARHTQPHHVTPFALDGPTDLDNLVSLCFVHHRQVELGRYVFLRKDRRPQPPAGAIEHALWWIIPPQPEQSERIA